MPGLGAVWRVSGEKLVGSKESLRLMCEPAEKTLSKPKNVWANDANQSTYPQRRECRAVGG